MAKESFDRAMADVPNLTLNQIDGSVIAYFSDHFTLQLMAGIIVQDYLGLTPKPSKRIESGGATGGMGFQTAWEAIASGRMNVCVAVGFKGIDFRNELQQKMINKTIRENTSAKNPPSYICESGFIVSPCLF